MERWNAYDRHGNITSNVLIRGQVIPKGQYHLVADVLVRHLDGSFLTVQRALSKETNPGKFEASIGGSALFGEDGKSCALRELKEETGIQSIISLDEINKSQDSNTLYINYLCVTDCIKNDLTLQPTETINYQWLNLQTFLDFIQSEQAINSHIQRISPYLQILIKEAKSSIK